MTFAATMLTLYPEMFPVPPPCYFAPHVTE